MYALSLFITRRRGRELCGEKLGDRRERFSTDLNAPSRAGIKIERATSHIGVSLPPKTWTPINDKRNNLAWAWIYCRSRDVNPAGNCLRALYVARNGWQSVDPDCRRQFALRKDLHHHIRANSAEGEICDCHQTFQNERHIISHRCGHGEKPTTKLVAHINGERLDSTYDQCTNLVSLMIGGTSDGSEFRLLAVHENLLDVAPSLVRLVGIKVPKRISLYLCDLREEREMSQYFGKWSMGQILLTNLGDVDKILYDAPVAHTDETTRQTSLTMTWSRASPAKLPLRQSQRVTTWENSTHGTGTGELEEKSPSNRTRPTSTLKQFVAHSKRPSSHRSKRTGPGKGWKLVEDSHLTGDLNFGDPRPLNHHRPLDPGPECTNELSGDARFGEETPPSFIRMIWTPSTLRCVLDSHIFYPNLILRSDYKIIRFLRNDNHADVYLATSWPLPSHDLEVHAFLPNLHGNWKTYAHRRFQRLKKNASVVDSFWHASRKILVVAVISGSCVPNFECKNYETEFPPLPTKEIMQEGMVRKIHMAAEYMGQDLDHSDQPLCVDQAIASSPFQISKMTTENFRRRRANKQKMQRRDKRQRKRDREQMACEA